jgi:hypothetical protein
MDALRMWQHLMDDSNPPPPEAVEEARRAIEVGYSGDWSKAEQMLLDSLAPLEAVEAPQAASANHNLAGLLQERGDLDGAVFHAVRAVFLYNRKHDVGGIYCSLRNLAVVHTSRCETRLAMAAQHQASLARRELELRGLLEEVEQGRDAQGERLHMLRLGSARSRDAWELGQATG